MRKSMRPYLKEAAATEQTMVTIATFELLPLAEIACGRLRAEGVAARLADQHMAQFYNIAVGGIKLQVAARDVERAKRILAQDYSQALE